jgi:uncharacterized protein YggU (UPF0235/DUF167 family)
VREEPPRAGVPVVRLRVKVVPGAAREGLAGLHGDALKVRVAAAPERGRANRAVEALVARSLGLAPSAVRVVAGATAPLKMLEIVGAPVEAVAALVGGPPR